MNGAGQGVKDRLRQHQRNTHTPMRIHPDTSIHTPTRRQAHACARHMYAPSMPTHTFLHKLHTPPQTFSLPHLCTQVPSITLHILRMSLNLPPKSCHLHTDPHMCMSTVHIGMHTFSQTICGAGGKEAAGTNMHACHLHRRQAPHTPAYTPVDIHTSTSVHILTFALKSAPGSKTQTLKTCLSLATLPPLSLHLPTGLCTYVALPTNRGFCPHSPPPYPLLL